MCLQGTNIYQTARLGAGLTQERAAELLDTSVESIKAYETDIRVPPDVRVSDMAEVYGAPWLRLEHARRTDKLGLIPDAARARPFPLAAIQLYNYLLEWSNKRRGQQLLKIAEDGVIADEERPLYDEIVCELEGIAAALMSLMCCDTKKERPGVGAPERSRSRESTKPENLDKPIIPRSRGNASKICAGEAVNLQ